MERESENKELDLQQLLAEQNKPLLDLTPTESWAKKHIINPFLHSAFYEPASIVLGKSFKDGSPSAHSTLPELSIGGKKDTEQKSIIENVSEIIAGAAGAGVVYALAGKGAGLALRTDAMRSVFGSSLSKFLATESGSMITGAALYDTARHPNEGETRLGNAAAGATSFAVFMKGNSLTAELGMPYRIASLPLVGIAGGIIQKQVSVGIAQERFINQTELGEAMLGGAVINTVMPGLTKALSFSVERLSKGGTNYNSSMSLSPEQGIQRSPVAKATEPKAAELRPAELKSTELRSSELISTEPGSPKLSDPQARPAEQKSPEAKSSESKSAEQKSPELKSAEQKSPELKSAELKSPELKSPEEAKAPRKDLPSEPPSKIYRKLEREISEIHTSGSSELLSRIAEVGDSTRATIDQVKNWSPSSYDKVSAADAKFIHETVSNHPELYNLIYESIDRIDSIPVRLVAKDVLAGRTGTSSRELKEALADAQVEAERHAIHHEEIRDRQDMFNENSLQLREEIEREFHSSEEASQYERIMLSIKAVDSNHHSEILPEAVHQITNSEMSGYPADLLAPVVRRRDYNDVLKFSPTEAQLAQAQHVWENAPSLPIELALKFKDASLVDQVAADLAWRKTLSSVYGAKSDYHGRFDTQSANNIHKEGDIAAFQAEFQKIKSSSPESILAADPEHVRAAAIYKFADVLSKSQIEQMLQRLHGSIGREHNADLISKVLLSIDKANFKKILEKLPKDPDNAITDFGSTTLSAPAQAALIVHNFGRNAEAYLNEIQAKQIDSKDAASKLFLSDQSKGKPFGDFYFENQAQPIFDRHRIAVIWNSLSAEQQNLSFKELEKLSLQKLAERAKGVMGQSPEGYRYQQELELLKAHPDLEGPIRRAIIRGMGGETTITSSQEYALSRSFSSDTIRSAFSKLGLPDTYKDTWHKDNELSAGDPPVQVLFDTAKRAIVVSSIFGERLNTWFDIQAKNGRGPLLSSNIVPYTWTEGLIKPFRNRQWRQQKIVPALRPIICKCTSSDIRVK